MLSSIDAIMAGIVVFADFCSAVLFWVNVALKLLSFLIILPISGILESFWSQVEK